VKALILATIVPALALAQAPAAVAGKDLAGR